MNIEAMVVHGWKFQLHNQQLTITSENDPSLHLELPAPAALSLLDYLYQYRDDVATATKGSTGHEEQTDIMTTYPGQTTKEA